MTETDPHFISRRKWIGLVSPPALAASVGAGLLGAKALAAEPAAPAEASSDLGARTYNIRDYGAKGDGMTLDTAAVQAAIDACHRDGGGTVLVPAGVFHIGTIELKSNVTLHLAAAGKLLGSADGKQYHGVDAIPTNGDSTLGDGHWALIFAVEARNVTVEGPGMVDGQGLQFHAAVRGEPPPSGLGGNRRPYLLLFYHCQNLTVRDIDLFRSAYHTVRVIESNYVHLDGLHIYNRVTGNNDGFHFISAQHVTVSNCIVQSQDDACALFGSCQFVTITNCSFSTRWSVFRFGGGVARNIAVSNCLLYQVFGCPIKMHCGPGSRFENMSFSNLVLQEVTGPINISVGPYGQRRRPVPAGGAAPAAAAGTPADVPPPAAMTPSEPIAPATVSTSATPSAPAAGAPAAATAGTAAPPHTLLDLPAPERDAGPGIVRNISFSNIHGTVTTDPPPLPDFPFNRGYNPGEKMSAIVLNCVGDSIVENISFDNLHLTFGGGGTAEDAARRDLPKTAGEYFELGPIPAYGFYARNSRGVTLQNVRFQVSQAELRPALILDHVEDVAINGFSVQGNPQAESVLRFIDAKKILFTAVRVLNPSPVFLQLEGTGNEGIIIDGGDLTQAAAPLAFKNGATESAVKLRS
ncbi:MAG TPA: glycosyl hydrolase family 28 protein [Opitutaceae bacterium]|nr:glycosyl hydrolase family 28 protein [Opitutaceae bacterium]